MVKVIGDEIQPTNIALNAAGIQQLCVQGTPQVTLDLEGGFRRWERSGTH